MWVRRTAGSKPRPLLESSVVSVRARGSKQALLPAEIPALSEAGRILRSVLVLRADPWAPEYGMGFDAAGQDEPAAQVDAAVEASDWSGPIPSSQPDCP